MQVVIDIPDELYEDIKEHGLCGYCSDREIMSEAIANGTPLPKGHGKLKDVDHYVKMQWEHPDYSLTDDEPTIIEADKEA